MKGTRRRMSGMLTDAAMGIKKALHPWGGGEKWSRKLLPLLVMALVCSNIGGMMPYGAERAVTKQIEEFEELPEDVLYQQVPEGTKKRELNLPKSLRGFVVVETIPDGGDTATPSEAKKNTATPSEAVKNEDADETVATSSTATKTEEGEWKNIRAVWELDGSFSDGEEYDGEIPGTYVFDAVLARDTYQLSSAGLPRIVVEVLPVSDGSLITDWEWLDEQEVLTGDTLSLPGASKENRAGYETIVSMLPERIRADVKKADGTASEGLEEEVGISGWECSDYPEAGGDDGEYTFMALLTEGYGLEDGVRPLHVKVQLGGGNLYANDEYDGLTITAANGGSVSQATDRQITLNASGDYEISGTWSGTLDGADRDNKKAVITVPDSVTANVTFSDLTIDVGSTKGACAFAVEANGTADITLSGTNTLTSGDYCAGLEVPENAAVTIDGNGSLEANGGSYGGAGIGGGSSDAGGTITINGGTVNATGGDGAGIGGGSYGAGGTITINGGTVNATTGGYGAGIGGGPSGAGGTITINDGTVIAKGSIGNGGAGIGGGGGSIGGDGGTIEINGGTVIATGGAGGAGIGGGGGYGYGSDAIGGSGGTITINGGTVTATGGGAGIGGGVSLVGDSGGSGGTVKISGTNTVVTATSNNSREGGYDVGGGGGRQLGDGGSLSVTDGATLEMTNTGTNVTDPVYVGCTIKDKNGTKYYPLASPTLTLEANPSDSLTLSGDGKVTLTAALSGAFPDNSGKTITFTMSNNPPITQTTDSSGAAVYTITNPLPGTYTFGASFAGDGQNNPVSAAEITGYTVNLTASGGSTRNSDGSSSISTGDRTYDPKKGWVSPQTGIITGTGSGYSRWLQDETGWELQYADGTMAAGVSVTAYDGRTYERLTWELINGAWYAFGADGYAESGLVFDPDLGGYFYIDINTGMKTGWQLIDGKWYYFNTVSDGRRGIMLVDTWVEGWYVDKNGIWDGKEKEE